MSGEFDTAPRGAIPNWQPALTIDDYVRNCLEGLEEYSDRRAAQVLGWTRIEVYRAKLMAHLPNELFERLLAAGVTSSKALANVALALRRGQNDGEVEHCPHCGGVLRVRWQVGKTARDVINEWLAEAGR
jgi:hypothetical protein